MSNLRLFFINDNKLRLGIMSSHTYYFAMDRDFRLINDRNDLADFLGIDVKKLNYVLYVRGTESYYENFDIPKKNGGVRHISAPTGYLRVIQKNLAGALMDYRVQLTESGAISRSRSYAFERKKWIYDNAILHRGKRLVLNVDLCDYFDSFHFGRIVGFLKKNRNFQMNSNIAIVIANLCCYNGKLPQGAPTSPVLTNFIASILDNDIIKLSKKYHLFYTRYADDLTFSTNDKQFANKFDDFLFDLENVIKTNGFSINTKKTRLEYKESRQVVTGLVVNKKANIRNDYYKTTRAMAYSLYRTGKFKIDNDEGTFNQLEGRLAYIYRLEQLKRNNCKESCKKLTAREIEYSKLLFYKSFVKNSRPLIITEGKTDNEYLKAALKNLYKDYPTLIYKDEEGFHFKVELFKRSKKTERLFNLPIDGADGITKMLHYFTECQNKPDYLNYFYKLGNIPKKPVILLFDNELDEKSKKPLRKFINSLDRVKLDKKRISENIIDKYYSYLLRNIFLLTTDLCKEHSENSEIEDLFLEYNNEPIINGKTFSRDDDAGKNGKYGKIVLAQYVSKNYNTLNFDGFRPLLDRIVKISKEYNDIKQK